MSLNWTEVKRADGTTVLYEFQLHRFRIVVYPRGMTEMYDEKLDAVTLYMRVADAKERAERYYRSELKKGTVVI